MPPIEYQVDVKTGVILSRGWGAISNDDLLRHAERVWNDPAATPDTDELLDLREASLASVTSDGVRQLSELARAASGGASQARLAVVAATDLVYGFTRMYEMLSDEAVLRVRAFRSIEEARAWLGIG